MFKIENGFLIRPCIAKQQGHRLRIVSLGDFMVVRM